MTRKLFALASVSALTGLVSAVAIAGCTSDPAPPDSSPLNTDAEAGKPPGNRPDTGPVEDADAPGCLSKDPVDATQIPYATAKKVAGACTADEAKALKKFLDDAIAANNFNFKQSEWAETVSTDCASCVFTKADDAEWGVIIAKADDPEAFLTYNRGGCVEIQSNNEACGRSYQQFQNCALVACGECTSQEDFEACLEDPEVYKGPCADSIEAVKTACGTNVGAYETACKGGLPTFINAHCIAPKALDASDAG